MILTVLKIFIKIIEIENTKCSNSSAEWNFKDYELDIAKIKERQNQLVKIGIVEMICDLVSSGKKQIIKENSILLGIALLIDGNKSSQEAFYKTMNSDKFNCFISSLNEIIVSCIESVKKSMNNFNKKIFEFLLSNPSKFIFLF